MMNSVSRVTEYDDLDPPPYGNEYPSSISVQMQVPDSIAVVKDDRGGDFMPGGLKDFAGVTQGVVMDVPDRILVAGQDQHIGQRQGLDLHNDAILRDPTATNEYVGLTTPPHTLTLEEHSYGGDPLQKRYQDEDEEDDDEEYHQQEPPHVPKLDFLQNGFLTPRSNKSGFPSDLLATPGDGMLLQDEDTDDMERLQKQVVKLTRHVIQMEKENAQRKTREMILYPTIVGYFLFKLATWFLRNN